MSKKYKYTKKTGRPPKFKKKEEIDKIFKEYESECEKSGKILTKIGFLIKLSFSRESYNKYKKKKEFIDTFKKIEGLIEDAWLQSLHHGKQATGPIFYLKNAFKEDYKDTSDITSGGKPIPLLSNVSNNNSTKKDTEPQKED